MDELVRQVSQKVGISEDMSRKAVETVLNYLKSKLPDAVGSQLDTAAAGGSAGGVVKGLGDLLGGKK